MPKLRHTIVSELTGMWATLSDSLYSDMDGFADKLYAKGIISRGLRRERSYSDIMDSFVATMQFFKTVGDFQKHCSTLIHILTELGGTAAASGAALRDAWNTAIRDKFGITFLA